MTSFSYSAINVSGRRLTGEIAAADLVAARDALRQQGLLPLEVREQRAKAARADRKASGRGVKGKSLQVFARQLATMIAAGVSVVSALTVLEEQSEDRKLAAVVGEVRRDVESGKLLSEAMARHPGVFSEIFVSMVEAGEAAGALDTVLDRVAFQIEKALQIKRRVKGAAAYPVVVMGFATMVLIGMLLFLVPVFQGLFDDLGGELPLPTKIVVAASDGLRGYWYIILPLAGLSFFGLKQYLATPGGRARRDRAMISAPAGVGSVVRKVAMARFSRTLATLISAGVDIMGALDIAGKTSGSTVVADATNRVRERVRQGSSIAEPMRDDPIFPPMVAQMVGVGEESGELAEMLSKVADFYEDEVDAAISSLTSVIEPILMVGVGIMVGVVIISMYLPMFKLFSLIK